jgi:hypothetical protein
LYLVADILPHNSYFEALAGVQNDQVMPGFGGGIFLGLWI